MKSSRHLQIDGKQIYVELINAALIGCETPLVLLHEGLGSTGQWKSFPETLANVIQAPIILYDRVGYGKSTSVLSRDTSYLADEAQNYLPAILESLQIDVPINIYGHSDGATIALLFAAFHPEKCNKVVAAAPHVIIEDVTQQGVQGAVWAYQHSDFKQRLEKYHEKNTDTMFWSWANFWTSTESRDWNMLEELTVIKSPVLFIQGTNDTFGTLMQGQLIKQKVSGIYQELVIDKCGHIPHLEFMEKVIHACSRFLNG